MSLNEKLANLSQQIKEKAPKEVIMTMEDEIQKLAESGVLDTTLKVGNEAPGFQLQNSKGDLVSLDELLQKGSLVISFNRGNWCPFCSLEFRELQDSIGAIKNAGGNLVVLSPQLPSKSAELLEQNGYDFPILYDKENSVAKKFGISFTLADSLRPIHKAFHMDIPDHNGNDSYELPLAATFVINQDRKIAYSYVNVNWMERTELKEYINLIK